MSQIDKVQFCKDSGFDLECAMELANLISVAYNEYEVWDKNEDLQDNIQLPSIITGSKAFIDLNTNNLEEFQQSTDNHSNKDYQRLNQFWKQNEEQLETYDRIESFWFPQWWWLDALNPKNLWEFINKNIKNIFKNLRDLVVDEPIFGFIARSRANPNKFFVVFRGTREAAEWFNNLRPVPKPFLPQASFDNLGEVRNGFNLIYSSHKDGIDLDQFFKSKTPLNYSTIEQTIDRVFNEELNAESEIFITGHSLGAGLATLAALHISKIAEQKNITSKHIQLYTFASPRVGDETFASHFDTDAIQSFRIINSEDLIQSVPLPTTEVIDDETFATMSQPKQARFLAFRTFLNTVTDGQSKKHYQHVGIPITFTKQTGTIAGNHNLTNTYREALDI
jgi:hypothetical protein